jgi:hypothetical protein
MVNRRPFAECKIFGVGIRQLDLLVLRPEVVLGPSSEVTTGYT